MGPGPNTWGPTGYLTGTIEKDRDGAVVSRHRLHVDALGELAAVDGAPLWWDTAAPVPTLAGANSTQVLSLPGGVTGVGEAWTAPGWRAARPTDQHDPWAVLGTPTTPHPSSPAAANTDLGVGGVLPAGVALTAGGGIDIAGLEWLGERAYDPATRGFLSTDPLAPVLGAGWDGNPYSYAGNNPLNTTDPTGLRPLTDADLKAYDGSSRGAFAASGDWLGDNWEYVVGGAAVVGGAVLMFVPGGQLAGMGLMSFGADAVIQKATTGQVNWGQAAISGGLGMIGGGVEMMAGKLVNNPVARIAVENGVEGAISGAGGYLTGPGPHTPTGLLGATALGGGTGALPIGGAANRAALPALPTARLGQLPPSPLGSADRSGSAYIASADGVVIPTNRSTLETGFQKAGFASKPTDSMGTQYTMPDGSLVRIMEPSGGAPLRASFTNANEGPVQPFTGKPVQPPRGLTRPERALYVRERTHIELMP